MSGKTLVFGATGNTGSGVAGSLLAEGRAVRALVRDAAKAEDLREGGAEIVVGDLTDPSTLTDALFEGVDTLYVCIFNGEDQVEQWHNLMDALRSSGAEPYIVRLSAFGRTTVWDSIT